MVSEYKFQVGFQSHSKFGKNTYMEDRQNMAESGGIKEIVNKGPSRYHSGYIGTKRGGGRNLAHYCG